MISMLRPAFALAMLLLVGPGLALPASAWPLRHIGQRHPSPAPTVLADCNVSYRNVCYLRMNACFFRFYRRPAQQSEYQACEAAYFDCIHRFHCQRGPVW
jgi:hypothetical protein